MLNLFLCVLIIQGEPQFKNQAPAFRLHAASKPGEAAVHAAGTTVAVKGFPPLRGRILLTLSAGALRMTGETRGCVFGTFRCKVQNLLAPF